MEDKFKAFEKEITDAANRLSIDVKIGMHDFVKTTKRESELTLPSHPIS